MAGAGHLDQRGRHAAQLQGLPLLLLSHGTGGSAMSLGWLARGLAAQGYLVALTHRDIDKKGG